MDRQTAAEWLARYIRAWESYDREAIGALFSDGVEYRYHPADDPVVGREAVVDSWLDDPDAPGTFEAEYEPFAVEGDRVVAIGWSRYFGDAARTSVRAVYDNIFAMEFDAAGRCRRFTEWFRERDASNLD